MVYLGTESPYIYSVRIHIYCIIVDTICEMQQCNTLKNVMNAESLFA